MRTSHADIRCRFSNSIRTDLCVLSMRSNNHILRNNIRKFVLNSICFVDITTTETNEVTLIDTLYTGQCIETCSQNLCNRTVVVTSNVSRTIIDLYFLFVEDRLGANEPLTVIVTKNNGRSTVPLGRSVLKIDQRIQNFIRIYSIE